jgi:hypothetical protein
MSPSQTKIDHMWLKDTHEKMNLFIPHFICLLERGRIVTNQMLKIIHFAFSGLFKAVNYLKEPV